MFGVGVSVYSVACVYYIKVSETCNDCATVDRKVNEGCGQSTSFHILLLNHLRIRKIIVSEKLEIPHCRFSCFGADGTSFRSLFSAVLVLSSPVFFPLFNSDILTIFSSELTLESFAYGFSFVCASLFLSCERLLSLAKLFRMVSVEIPYYSRISLSGISFPAKNPLILHVKA